MVKTSVLMTVHDREAEVLLATLRSLWRSGLGEAEVIIVDDRSGMDYSWVRDYARARFAEVKWVTTGDYPGYRLDGYGNPAHAFNSGLALATGERLVVMSSDVIVTPDAVRSMDRFWTPSVLYTPRVVDLDSNKEYCGAARLFPMPWFLVMPTEVAQEIGGWDEAFMGGFCFEDNDFVGRMALRLGAVRCDWIPVVYHQSHVQPAYDHDNPEVVSANDRNRALCREKWGGIPFDGDYTPFTMLKKQDAAGCFRLEVANEALKERFFGVKT